MINAISPGAIWTHIVQVEGAPIEAHGASFDAPSDLAKAPDRISFQPTVEALNATAPPLYQLTPPKIEKMARALERPRVSSCGLDSAVHLAQKDSACSDVGEAPLANRAWSKIRAWTKRKSTTAEVATLRSTQNEAIRKGQAAANNEAALDAELAKKGEAIEHFQSVRGQCADTPCVATDPLDTAPAPGEDAQALVGARLALQGARDAVRSQENLEVARAKVESSFSCVASSLRRSTRASRTSIDADTLCPPGGPWPRAWPDEATRVRFVLRYGEQATRRLMAPMAGAHKAVYAQVLELLNTSAGHYLTCLVQAGQGLSTEDYQEQLPHLVTRIERKPARKRVLVAMVEEHRVALVQLFAAHSAAAAEHTEFCHETLYQTPTWYRTVQAVEPMCQNVPRQFGMSALPE